MEEERKEFEQVEDLTGQAAEAVNDASEEVEETEGAPLLSDDSYHPRPTWQKVLAWALLGIVIVGIVLWYLEIATAGSLFGLLD